MSLISTFHKFSLITGYCPIPVMMDHINFNYEYWKQQYDSSPNISEDETGNRIFPLQIK